MEGEFNLMEAASELTTEENGGTEVALHEETVDQGQSQIANPENDQAADETDPGKILEQIGLEKPAEEGNPDALVEQLNALGLVHNGVPLKVESLDQVKELIQKGQDYTKKTMAHAEEVKAKDLAYTERETQLQAREVELNDVVQDNKILENLLIKWQQDDPALFAEIQAGYQSEIRNLEMNKPAIAKYENQFNELKNEIKSLKDSKTNEQHEQIRNGWDTELSQTQVKSAAQLKTLGVNVDWDKVKETWAADTTNKLTVEQAMFAKYGPEIQKANLSYQNLLKTKKTTNQKVHGRAGANAASSEERQAPTKMGDYGAILKMGASEL